MASRGAFGPSIEWPHGTRRQKVRTGRQSQQKLSGGALAHHDGKPDPPDVCPRGTLVILVDPLFDTKPYMKPSTPRCFRSTVACHMISDQAGLAGTRELLAFALRLGLRREWLQEAGAPGEHFDLTAAMRDKALRMGARDVAATALAGVVAARRPRTQVPRRRHKWVRHAVVVAWSSVPGSIRTCRICGMTRQSVPSENGRSWRVEYGIPMAGAARRYVDGKTPPCPGFVPNSSTTQPRESETEGPGRGVGVQDFDAQGSAEAAEAFRRHRRRPRDQPPSTA